MTASGFSCVFGKGSRFFWRTQNPYAGDLMIGAARCGDSLAPANGLVSRAREHLTLHTKKTGITDDNHESVLP
jgi:hypothetical protein